MLLDYDGDGTTDQEIYPNYIPISNFSYEPILPTTDDIVYFNDCTSCRIY